MKAAIEWGQTMSVENARLGARIQHLESSLVPTHVSPGGIKEVAAGTPPGSEGGSSALPVQPEQHDQLLQEIHLLKQQLASLGQDQAQQAVLVAKATTSSVDSHQSNAFFNAPIPMAMSNAQGQFLCANAKFMQLFGFESEEQVCATGFFHMSDPGNMAQTFEGCRQLLSGEMEVLDIPGKICFALDGTKLRANVKMQLYDDPKQPDKSIICAITYSEKVDAAQVSTFPVNLPALNPADS
jgi:hypothetical protein